MPFLSLPPSDAGSFLRLYLGLCCHPTLGRQYLQAYREAAVAALSENPGVGPFTRSPPL